MKRTSLLATLAIGTLLGVTACGGPTEDQTPTTTETASSPTSTTATTSASASDTPLAGVDPCGLLTDAQVRELGVAAEKERDKIGTARTCDFFAPIDASPAKGTAIGIREHTGLKEFVGDFTKSTIAGHKVKIQCYTGNCLIGIAVTESSRVDIQGSVVGDDAATKRYAKKIARMVISNLPKSD